MPTADNTWLPDNFAYAARLLDAAEFEIPRKQPAAGEYFPDYLRQQLTKYAEYYDRQLRPHFEGGEPFGDENRVIVLPEREATLGESIQHLADGLCETVRLYYAGHVPGATQLFHQMLDSIFEDLGFAGSLGSNMIFYRARPREGYDFTRHDLFHNPFQNRGKVATNRYSIPGLPALYMGDSAYVCWKEANQERINNLYFSRLDNVRPVRLVRIQRLPDFVAMVDSIGTHPAQLMFMAGYLIVFPLLLACSIRTRFDQDTFKPEYIIPQLLLQYVTAEQGVEGIMYPSSKVDYSRLKRVSAYNYVFPVKQIQSTGFCSELVSTFRITPPTSIELEELMSYGAQRTYTMDAYADILAGRQTLTIADGTPKPYATTSFGFIEASLEKAKNELRHLNELP